jgi:hypothetical protein
MLHDSWFNSTPSLALAWGGSTALTFLNYIQHSLGDTNPLTIIGWFIITGYGIVSSISKIKVNNSKAEEHRAEARKLNAEAAKIENEIATTKDHEKCVDSDCSFKVFYDNYNPILMSHFGENFKQEPI